MRTTLDISMPVLREMKNLQRRTGKSLGNIASELLSQALAARSANTKPAVFKWTAQSMGASRVDLRDKEALRRALDETPTGVRK
ncbi:MAG: antitoxin [Deltaproteobacteria bacterium]|nr:antitoxin [Deltaproteobacteria bacterium]